jgi:hypothetical protein
MMAGKAEYVRAGMPFQPSAIQQNWFIDTARFVDQHKSTFSSSSTIDNNDLWYFGKIAAGSSVASGSFASPTSGLVDQWVPNWSSGASPRPLMLTTDTTMRGITVVNMWNLCSAATAGTQCAFKRKYDFWVFVWLDV